MLKGINLSVSATSILNEIPEELNITVNIIDTKDTVYCKKTKRVTNEKYILNITADDILIECSGEKSAFYALCDIAKRIRDGELQNGLYVCSPSFSVRGYIEGFYGTPWSHNSRKSFMATMAKNRMNTVYYAPKDDIYHREEWRKEYPNTELNCLQELVSLAKEYYMDFYWCIAPGLSIKYSDETEFLRLINKTRQMYSIGIRNFGLLLDDISAELEFEEDKKLYTETVNAHIDIINRYHTFLLSLDNSTKLTVCPTVYHGQGNEYYISKLGQNISPLVSIFWTGKDICSRELTSFEAVKFITSTYHKPLYWDNYPVNDCSMYNEMHISPIINRAADLYKYSEGIISNCMEYPECSKIPLITFADYLWNSENYSPQLSWERAINQIIGKKYAKSFIAFADHLYTSCLKDSNSRRLYDVFDKIEEANKSNDKQNALKIFENYLTLLSEAKEFLSQDTPLCNELKKWTEKFFAAYDILFCIFQYLKDNDKTKIPYLLSLVDKYHTLPARFSNDIDIRAELKNELGIE